jgi:hypothetical protein
MKAADSLGVESLLELLDEESLRKDTALPSPEWSSDHIALLAEFRCNLHPFTSTHLISSTPVLFVCGIHFTLIYFCCFPVYEYAAQVVYFSQHFHNLEDLPKKKGNLLFFFSSHLYMGVLC